MEHQEAIEIHAAEGYVLGDLPAAQHDAFEEHFADCEACFADVRDGATVVAAMRAEGKKNVVRRGRHRFIPTLAAAASIAVAIITIAYQRVQIAELRQPHFAPVEVVSEMRGPEDKLVVRRDIRNALSFDIVGSSVAPFTCKIVDAKGNPLAVSTISAEQAKKPIDLDLPRRSLDPGEYSLIVTGTGGVSVLNKGFAVQ